jgi:hypothetical protein
LIASVSGAGELTVIVTGSAVTALSVSCRPGIALDTMFDVEYCGVLLPFT